MFKANEKHARTFQHAVGSRTSKCQSEIAGILARPWIVEKCELAPTIKHYTISGPAVARRVEN
jgi:hypothetical protein